MLLSLLFPSCIVASIRELVNTLISSTTTASISLQMTYIPSAIEMDIYNNITRGKSYSSSRNSSRELLILSNISSVAYYKQIEILNNILPDEV